MVVGRPSQSPGVGNRLLAVGLRCGSGVSYSSAPGVWPWEGLLASLRCRLSVVALVRWSRAGAFVADAVAEYW